jgi:hypothetical protein
LKKLSACGFLLLVSTLLAHAAPASAPRLAAAGALSASAAHAPEPDLPDAPVPQDTSTPQDHVVVPGTRPATPEAIKKRKWSPVIEPGEKIPPMFVRDKLLFPVHEEWRVSTLVPILYAGGYGLINDSDPEYGTDSKAFGERVGATAARQAIARTLSDGLLPIVFHEDPRYFRMAYGSYEHRAEHAIHRIFITQTDAGANTFNFSGVLGNGIAAALTQTYYPSASIRPTVPLKTWGLSLAALGGGNLFEEFWPDFKQKFFHRSQ